MMLSAAVVLLLTCGGIVTDGSLLNLATMIKDVTGKSAIPDYSFYGCYCGLGGKGRPVDATDRCCQQHDCCYSRADRRGCESKTHSYFYTYSSGKVKCGDEPWWWRTAFRDGLWCQRQLCECDRVFVKCLKRHSVSYKKAYRYHPNFLCFGSSLRC